MGPTAEQVAEARLAYANGEPMASLCRRLKLRRATIMAIRDREQWTVQPAVQPLSGPEARAIRERSQAQVIDILTGQALERPEAAKTVCDIAVALQEQAALAIAATRLAAKTLSDIEAGSIEPAFRQSRAQLALDGVKTAAEAVQLTRAIAGLRPDKPNTPSQAQQDEKVAEVQLIIVDEAVSQ